ncbi:Nlp family transcriptional regulator [Enterobacter sp. BIGb0383]|uniref:helix-turn-helix domain-containing protein n=1 Tax=unclassified Enterobacter TaxID=2608935 RepID=UPI000F46D755|nr:MULTISPECIES: helix-turn-helix transcriptional regulator [unclassified Enterobacter]ROP60004.1 Nlp family transcriptional regulator [Enterobacter sp. BIGb0383]ROS08527.1 Nlp family transcriptional regulator [Enterobacter sp. BIGb0359]
MVKTDMHPADIIAGLKKKRMSMAALSRQAGLSSSTLANALSRPWPKGEHIIAQALEMDPADIWPSRYYDESGNLIDRTRLMRVKKE